MAQIHHYDKRVGITYVYESESYYDPEKKQSRSKRKLIGKIDPETGEIVPTGRRGRPSKNITQDEAEVDYQKLYQDTNRDLLKAEAKLQQTQSELAEAKIQLRHYRERLSAISVLCAKKV